MMNTGFYAKGKLPWSERAKSGFICCDSDSYNTEDMRINCEYGYDVRTNCIENSLKTIEGERKLYVDFANLNDEFLRVCQFVESYTEVKIGKIRLLFLSRVKKRF